MTALAAHRKKIREYHGAAMVETNARIKMLNEISDASVSGTKLAGIDRDVLTEAWGAQPKSLSAGAAPQKEEIEMMINNILLQTSALQNLKRAVPMVIANATSSGSNAGNQNGKLAETRSKEPLAGDEAEDAKDLMEEHDTRKAAEEESGAQPAAKKQPGESLPKHTRRNRCRSCLNA